MKQFSVIILGAGSRGQTYSKFMNEMPDKYKIVGVAEPVEFKRRYMQKKYGIAAFDAYLFFDADNLLTPNFIAEMNKAYESGADIITGYRNALNFGENFISAAYGIHFLRSNAFFTDTANRLRGALRMENLRQAEARLQKLAREKI